MTIQEKQDEVRVVAKNIVWWANEGGMSFCGAVSRVRQYTSLDSKTFSLAVSIAKDIDGGFG